ncbi:MAG: SRPBCC domain-containing protein [Bacteroidetes bacterium]|nr:SRPBCC domain-containing protein [Bacteroidota bacterium]
MSKTIAAANDISERELSITRVLNAPRGLVWKVFTEENHIKNWWGPEGFTNTIHSMDVKTNGHWSFIMHGPDGRDYPNEIVYVEVVKPERIVFDHIAGPRHRTTIIFEARHQQTILHFKMLFASAEVKQETIKTYKADIGLVQNIDKLEMYLEKVMPDKELTLTRILKAPRDVVFNAWIDVKQLAKWWGPGGFTNPVCEIDVKPGGKIYIEMKAPDGTVYPMNGEFIEVIKSEKIVFVSGALDKNGQTIFEVMNTVTFEEDGKNTKLTLHAVVDHVSADAKPYIGGMDEGWSQSLVRLEQLVMGISQ